MQSSWLTQCVLTVLSLLFKALTHLAGSGHAKPSLRFTRQHMTGAGHAKQQAHTVRPDRAPAFLTLWYLTTEQWLLNSKDSPLAYNSTDTQHHNIKHCC